MFIRVHPWLTFGREMKTLHLYLTRQVLGTLVMTVFVFTFVLVLGNVLKEIFPLLINGQTTLWMVTKAIGLLIPYVLVYALPMGMLTATLLTFGRFSADQELTAVRASGISLMALVTPILILSVALSGFCALINLHLAPLCRSASKRIISQAAMKNPSNLLREKQYVTGIPGGYGVYVDRRKGDEVFDVEVSQTDEKGVLIRWLRAPRGELQVDTNKNEFVLHLFDSRGAGQDNGDWNNLIRGDFELPFSTRDAVTSIQSTKISDMTFSQVRKKIAELEDLNRQQPPPDKLPPDLREKVKRAKVLDLAMPAKVQMNRMVSFSFACIGFTLVGIPLGIRSHRRETSIGIAFALLLAIVYYSFLILGGALEMRPELFPAFIVWIPNFIFQAVGGFLLWRANKGLH